MTHIITGVKRDGNVELSYQKGMLTLTFTENYHVLADSKTATMFDVMANATATDVAVQALLYGGTNALPLPGTSVDHDNLCTCKTLDGVRDDQNPLKWTFTSTWSTEVDESNQGGDPTTDPETIIPIRETLYESVTRPRKKDLLGRPYVNGALNLFNPAVTFEEELPRWDFAQFDLYYDGPITGQADTFAGLPGTTGDYSLLTDVDYTDPPNIWIPGVYYHEPGGWVYYAQSDATIGFFNGAINFSAFLGYDPFTLALKVRSSKINRYYSVKRRLTEFSIIFDRDKWWDNPLNAGPFFMAPRLQGGVPQADYVSYPYIYYQSAIETPDTTLSQEDAGPLGTRDITIVYNGSTGLLEPSATWSAALDGVPAGGHQLVTTANQQKTYRALKFNPASVQLYSIEYAKPHVFHFAKHLRVT